MHRFDSVLESRMRQNFMETASTLQIEESLYHKDGKTLFVGMEIELPLITQDLTPSPQRERDAIVNNFPYFASVELGAHQLEVIHEPALDIKQQGICSIENALQDNLAMIGRKNQKDRKSTRLNSSHIPLSRMPSSA